jgi:hypothetical protein
MSRGVYMLMYQMLWKEEQGLSSSYWRWHVKHLVLSCELRMVRRSWRSSRCTLLQWTSIATHCRLLKIKSPRKPSPDDVSTSATSTRSYTEVLLSSEMTKK